MAYSRRLLLQTSLMGCGIGSVGSVLSAFVMAEQGTVRCHFSGPGFYLYPHWGEPRPYLVTQATVSTPTLEFRDPASKRVLWTQTLSLTDGFAGRLM